MQTKRILLVLVLLFAIVYYIGRIGIFYVAADGEMAFEEEQSSLVEAVVLYSFLAIGVVGLVLLPGVYLLKPWGFWGTLAVSVYTIAFDLWAFAMVQSSAAAGIIPAAVVLGYLVFARKDYLREPSAHPSGQKEGPT